MWLGDDDDQKVSRELKFVAIELGDSPLLDEGLRLELTPGTTVLVGKNGAGKSALLERLRVGFEHVLGAAEDPDPGLVVCEVADGERRVRYECALRSSVEEICILREPEPARVLWKVGDGRLRRSDGTHIELPLEVTLLAVTAKRRPAVGEPMAYPLINIFQSLRSIPPGAPRGHGPRDELVVAAHPSAGARLGRFERLLYRLSGWYETAREQYEELTALARRIGLASEILVKTYRDPDRKTARDRLSISIDGVDLGLLSDGTFRALELLCALVEPFIKLVLIDEPESAIHPGLLDKLLNEIDAYSTDRQIVMATHSPQVVSWAKPEAIRVVTRNEGVAHVQGLGERTIKHLEKYLHDEDTLGEFIYGGGLDDVEE